MLFYCVLLFFVLLFTNFLGRKNNNGWGYKIAASLLAIVAIVRFDVGWDYPNYYNIIDNVLVAGLSQWEPLSLGLALLAIYTNNTFLFFILSGCIIYPLAFYAFKKNSVMPSLSLIIYVGLFYLISCSIIRQAIAVSICLYAYKYIKAKSFFRYFLLVVLATLFHYSAFISLVIYPIYHHGKFKLVLALSIVMVFLRTFLFMILESYGLYADYLSRLNDISGGAITRLFYILLFLSFFIIIKYRKYTTEEKRFLSIILVGLFCPFLFGSGMGERIGYYFIIYYCYLIPILLEGKKRYKRGIYVSIFSLYFLLMIFYTSHIPGQKAAYTPYRTIFNITHVQFRQ